MPSSCGVRGEEGGGLNSGLLVTNRDAEKNLFLCDWTWEMVQKCKYACENSHGVPALCENFTQKVSFLKLPIYVGAGTKKQVRI